ncbi:MAG TPA: rRNA maturation factor, partial [Chitinophagaceae bacterium]|nr:rRNA maturation factor [Chitinophagaceae bacterium]
MIQFNYQTPVRIRHIRLLKSFLQDIIRSEKYTPGPLSFVFCTDDFLLQINQQYLNHHDYTDIITFNLSEEKGTVSGEMYISIDRIKDNAQRFK